MKPSERLKRAMAAMDDTVPNRQLVRRTDGGHESIASDRGASNAATGYQQNASVSDESVLSSESEESYDMDASKLALEKVVKKRTQRRPAQKRPRRKSAGTSSSRASKVQRAGTGDDGDDESMLDEDEEDGEQQQQQVEEIETMLWRGGVPLIKNSVRSVKARCVYASVKGNEGGCFLRLAEDAPEDVLKAAKELLKFETMPWTVFAAHHEEGLLDKSGNPADNVPGATTTALSKVDEETGEKPLAEANALAPLFCVISLNSDDIYSAASPFFDYTLTLAQCDPEVVYLDANRTVPVFLLLGVESKRPLLTSDFKSTEVINGLVDTLYAVAIATATPLGGSRTAIVNSLRTLDGIPQAMNPTSQTLQRSRFEAMNAVCSPADRRRALTTRIKRPYDDQMRGVTSGQVQPARALISAQVSSPSLLFNDTEKPGIAFELIEAGMPHTQLTRMSSYADRVSPAALLAKYRRIVAHMDWGTTQDASEKTYMPILVGSQVHLSPDWFPRYYNWLMAANPQAAPCGSVKNTFRLYRTFLASDLYMRAKRRLELHHQIAMALIPKSYLMQHMVEPPTQSALLRAASIIGGRACSRKSAPFVAQNTISLIEETPYNREDFYSAIGTVSAAVTQYLKPNAVVRCPRSIPLKIIDANGEEAYQHYKYPLVYEKHHLEASKHLALFLHETMQRWQHARESNALVGIARDTPPLIVKGLYAYAGPTVDEEVTKNVVDPLQEHCTRSQMRMVVIREDMPRVEFTQTRRANIEAADMLVFTHVHRWTKQFAALVAQAVGARSPRGRSLLSAKFVVMTGLSHVAGSPVGESMLHEFAECADQMAMHMRAKGSEFARIFQDDDPNTDAQSERPTLPAIAASMTRFGTGLRSDVLFPPNHRMEQLLKNEQQGVLCYAMDEPRGPPEPQADNAAQRQETFPEPSVQQKRDALYAALKDISEFSPSASVIILHRGNTREARMVAKWVNDAGFRGNCRAAVKYMRYSSIERANELPCRGTRNVTRPRLIVLVDVRGASYKVINAALEASRNKVLALTNKSLLHDVYCRSTKKDDISTLCIQTDSIIVERLKRLMSKT